jgi:alkylation response protein AidB-like acyl-CoA dehydrogenase
MTASPDPLAEARGLRPLIEAEALPTDEKLTFTEPVIDAFTRTGLFHLMVPREFGGSEADTDTILDVFEELAHQDGSIGWSHMANASATAYCAFLDPSVAREMVADKPGSVFAGQFAPRGQIKREEGGFRVQGHYGFGSGSGHASNLGGGGFVTGDDGQPEMLPNNLPAYLCFFTARENVELQGGWDVLGLRGTGSFDYEVPEQHIDSGSTFFLFDPQVQTGGALYGLSATGLAGLGHAGWGLGVARRALDEIEAIAQAGRVRLGSTTLADQQVFQRKLGEHELALRSVRLLVHDVYGRAIDRIAAGEPIDKATNDDLMGAVAYMTQVTQDVTLFAYQSAGSQGLRNPSIVQRCFRDMFTGGLHVFVDRRSYEEVAKESLGVA